MHQAVSAYDTGFGDAPNRATPAQWRARMKKMGVKDAELRASGVDDWLTAQGQRVVKKSEMQKIVADSQVEIETKELKGIGGEPEWREGMPFPRRSSTELAQYENPGLVLPGEYTNYRETLYRYPNKVVGRGPYENPAYEAPHFAQFDRNTNMFAHSRTSDRVAADGSKVRVLEELQSDWESAWRREDSSRKVFNEALARRGQAEEPHMETPDFPHRTSWVNLVARREMYQAALDGADHFAWTTAEQQAGRGMTAERARNLYEGMLPKAVKEELKELGVEAKVSTAKIPSSDAQRYDVHMDEEPGTYAVYDRRTDTYIAEHVDSLAEAQRIKSEAVIRAEQPVEMQAVRLTPALRRAILKRGIMKFAAAPAAGGALMQKTPEKKSTADTAAAYGKQRVSAPPPTQSDNTEMLSIIDQVLADAEATPEEKRAARLLKGELKGGPAATAAKRLEKLPINR